MNNTTTPAVTSRQVTKLSIVFALAYFFSTNGLASLPGITISFLLKDGLHMTATQSSYFAAITLIGWTLKPLWGIISDYVPLFGLRRKSYLVLTSLGAGIVWATLGQIEHYSVPILITLFALSSIMYAFMDVLVDALMVETGKPLGLTARFQSIQWTSVYVAAIITGVAGGWVATHLSPQITFSINALFPLVLLLVIIFCISEKKVVATVESRRETLANLKLAAKDKQFWLLAFFLFFWTFSPSFGAPFFYYSVDHLKFDQLFFGIVASVGAVSSAVGAILYGVWAKHWNTRRMIKWMIVIGVLATLFQLIFFLPAITGNTHLARIIYMGMVGVLGAIGSVAFLTMLNAAALACPRWTEGTVFATLTACWNIGLLGSDAVGGFLFSKIGLVPLIWVSAVFTALTWVILPRLRFGDEGLK